MVWLIKSLLFVIVFYQKLCAVVVSGDDCPIDKNPHMVSLRRYQNLSHYCGGTILKDLWILTAAHCLKGFTPAIVTVVAGTTYAKQNYQVSKSKQFHVHKKFVDAKKYDVALIELETPIQFGRNAAPVKLPDKYETNLQERCSLATVVGWGVTRSFVGGNPEHLQCANVTIFEKSRCDDLLKDHNFAKAEFDLKLCSFGTKKIITKPSRCEGDSGSPLMCGNVQYGIVSFDTGCRDPTLPTFYERVDYHLKFIRETFADKGKSGSAVNTSILSSVIVTVSLVMYCF